MILIIVMCVFVVRSCVIKADDPECNVVPMTQWAGKASSRKESLANPVDLVILQHSVTPEPTANEDCEHVIRAIRKYQQNALHFDDVAPSFMVCGNGKVYEGAGWSLVGAHTRAYNQKSIGISFIGEFSTHLPNSKALAAARALIACGVTNQHLTEEYKLVGHRQLTNTVSPGDSLQKEIETWPHWISSV